MYQYIRRFLFLLKPEFAHLLSLNILKLLHKYKLYQFNEDLPRKAVTVMGLPFVNPLGSAAGLDKSGEFIEPVAALGFGFLELGTVTLKPQKGNRKPRLFRLPKNKALINRMGFNNQGVDKLIASLKNISIDCILGVSITKNTDTSINDSINEYVTCYQKLHRYADFVTIDCSCPNVPDAKLQQTTTVLANLFKAMKDERDALYKKDEFYVPIAVKLSPDLSDAELVQTVNLILENKLDAVIATNTTRSRDKVIGVKYADEKGGLSGAPLFATSLAMIKRLHELVDDKIPIIAVGGIMSAKDAKAMLAAGATLLQIYTGFIYQGPDLIREIVEAV